MNESVELWETPEAAEKYMIVGWQQWADAGSISSGLPRYLIDKLNARKIGAIKPYNFYLFQIPGTHHFLRPEIKLNEGHRKSLAVRKNEIFYSSEDERGLFIFLGEEPHLNIEHYAEAFFDVIEALGVQRVGVVGGVYGATPYAKEREVSCTYSLRSMKKEMAEYAVRFSGYEGGATIGSYLLDMAEEREIEFFVFNAFVPAYDFSQLSDLTQGVRIDDDYKAWYDLMRRFNHMFHLGFDLTDLEQKSEDLLALMDDRIARLAKSIPQLNIEEYMVKVAAEFTERPFMPLSDVWEEGLGDLFKDLED
jgi:proteasome assembly chaperone (PAC2) family protein